MSSVTSLARGSVEAGSVKTYTPALHKFQALVRDTCAKLGVQSTSELRDLVNEEGVLEAFVVYAHEDGLRDTTIEVYIAGLNHFTTDALGRPQIPGARTVKILLKGCRKSQGPPQDGKLGIGILRLRSLLDHLNHTSAGRYEITLWKAMFCCVFSQHQESQSI